MEISMVSLSIKKISNRQIKKPEKGKLIHEIPLQHFLLTLKKPSHPTPSPQTMNSKI
jgi:hypothetical protein